MTDPEFNFEGVRDRGMAVEGIMSDLGYQQSHLACLAAAKVWLGELEPAQQQKILPGLSVIESGPRDLLDGLYVKKTDKGGNGSFSVAYQDSQIDGSASRLSIGGETTGDEEILERYLEAMNKSHRWSPDQVYDQLAKINVSFRLRIKGQSGRFESPSPILFPRFMETHMAELLTRYDRHGGLVVAELNYVLDGSRKREDLTQHIQAARIQPLSDDTRLRIVRLSR